MARIDLAYVKRFKDRHGKVRHYFRRRGFNSVALPGEAGSVEFMAAYAEAMKGMREIVSPTKDGSIEALFVAYYASREFRGLLPQTQSNYRSVMRHFEAKFRTWPANGFTTAALEKYLDERADTPGAASNFLKRIKGVLKFAKRRKVIDSNPSDDVQFKRRKTDGFPVWTGEDLQAFERKWPVGSRERLVYALALYTGQRRSDVVRMGPQHVKDGHIIVKQDKGGKTLEIPLHAELKKVLDVAPKGHLAYAMTEYDQPFTNKGFGKWFADRCDAAGIGKRMHGLRKAAATRLADAGCSAYEIGAITGHSSLKELEPYTRAADQKRLAGQAMRKVKGTKVSNPDVSNLAGGIEIVEETNGSGRRGGTAGSQ